MGVTRAEVSATTSTELNIYTISFAMMSSFDDLCAVVSTVITSGREDTDAPSTMQRNAATQSLGAYNWKTLFGCKIAPRKLEAGGIVRFYYC